jgi:hypothetical protein
VADEQEFHGWAAWSDAAVAAAVKIKRRGDFVMQRSNRNSPSATIPNRKPHAAAFTDPIDSGNLLLLRRIDTSDGEVDLLAGL